MFNLIVKLKTGVPLGRLTGEIGRGNARKALISLFRR